MIADRRPPPGRTSADRRPATLARGRIDPRVLGVAGLHLAALSSFAIAQPLFDVLGENAAFFAVRQSTALEIVAFAVLVTVAPAATLLLVEALAGLVDARARNALHLLFVVGLLSIIALQALKRTDIERSAILAALAGLGGAAGAFVYARSRQARSVLTVLAAAPLLFLSLFLFNSPVRTLLSAGEASARVANVSATAPVVMIVFDEFSVTSLMDRDGRIDPVRYPHFAKLARESTWFRNAVSVSPWTDRAVPAILTGNFPKTGTLPIYRNHPQSLFTLLGGSHELRVDEWITTLCPADLCPRRGRAAVAPGIGHLLSDLGVVYLHLLLPESMAWRLPAIEGTWGNFRGKRTEPTESPSAAFDRFLDSLERTEKPGLHFLHVELPHFPWRYLPSGQEYLHRYEFVPGVERERWKSDEWLARQGEQRYLLQVGFADRQIGRLVAKLRSARLYDRSLVAITADHGVSFRAGDGRRQPTATNVHDLAFVPLFVKEPGQTRARIVNRPLSTIDILPTMADLLNVRLPWRVEGRSALAGGSRPRRLPFSGDAFDTRELESRREAALARRISVFGARESWARVFAIGPHPALRGRRVADLPRTAATTRATIDDEGAFALVDRGSSFVPAYISGRIEGEGAAPLEPVAVAVNGRIAAVSRTHAEGDAVRFGAIVPPAALRDGPNDVAVYAVSSSGGRLALAPLGKTGAAPSFRLTRDAQGELLVSSAGRRIRVREGAVSGHVDWAEIESDRVTFVGWAADYVRKRPRERVAVFSDGRFVASFSAPVPRPDLGPQYVDAGYSFVLPLSVLTRRNPDTDVRVFGIAGDRASELDYPAGYRW